MERITKHSLLSRTAPNRIELIKLNLSILGWGSNCTVHHVRQSTAMASSMVNPSSYQADRKGRCIFHNSQLPDRILWTTKYVYESELFAMSLTLISNLNWVLNISCLMWVCIYNSSAWNINSSIIQLIEMKRMKRKRWKKNVKRTETRKSNDDDNNNSANNEQNKQIILQKCSTYGI